MTLHDTIVNVAPLFGRVALLGEAGKITSVSTYRFASVVGNTAGITASLRGKVGEVISLLFATAGGGGGLTCVAKAVTIGPGGTATAHLASSE
jgi:hypothetical protein